MASLDKPKYSVKILKNNGNQYNITNAVTELTLEESDTGIAQKATVSMAQLKHDGKYATSLFDVHDRIYIYANTGGGSKEVFRGYIWTKTFKKDSEREITFVCYDNLIYLQESEEYRYFSSGKQTKSIFTTICKSKGISLSYSHKSIKHAKLVIRGTLADIFETELLEPVRKKTGKRGVIRSTKGKMEVFTEGTKNSTVYKFLYGDGGNIESTAHETTMDGMTTKVIILGQEKDKKRAPIKATVTGETKKYGTLQKILQTSDSDKLSELKKEAKQAIKDDGKPKKYKRIVAVDNPWVRKGDKIYYDDRYSKGYGYVKSVKHDAIKGTIDMEIRTS